MRSEGKMTHKNLKLLNPHQRKEGSMPLAGYENIAIYKINGRRIIRKNYQFSNMLRSQTAALRLFSIIATVETFATVESFATVETFTTVAFFATVESFATVAFFATVESFATIVFSFFS